MRPTERDHALLKELTTLVAFTIDRVSPDKVAFLRDDDARDAAAMRAQTIGEYMRSLSESFRNDHPELPWHQAIAMRNIIAHEYGKVDYEILWNAITGKDFSVFLEQLTAIVD